MRDELKSLIQTAVRLDVEIFCVLVRDVKQLLRVAVNRTAVVDFKLYAEMAKALAVKYKVGRVAILVDNFAVLIPAGCAVSVVVAVPVCSVAMNNPATIIAADVVLVKAMLAERVRVILNGVFLVDPLGPVVADYG